MITLFCVFCGELLLEFIIHALHIVTNYYYGSIPVRMSSTWLAMGARVILSQGVTAVIHGCSFVHWANGKELLTVMRSGELVLCGELGCSSTFAVRMLNL